MSLKSIIKNYQPGFLKKDISAGMAVAAISFPQVMAYALLAGVNPVYGLYTFIISTIVATFAGRSNYMIVGPTNMVSVTIASSLNALGIVDAGNYIQYVFLLTFLVGIMQIILGSLKLGNLINYVSQTVIIALTVGVSLIIITSQLDKALGLTLTAGRGNVITGIYNIISNIHTLNYYAIGMSIFTLFIILVCKKYCSKLPSYLISVLISVIIVYIFNLGNHIEIIGEFDSSLPEFNLPYFNFEAIKNVFSSALSIAILGFTQVLSIVKVMEKETGQEVDLNKEFIGQGVMNTVCSFFSGFVATGSFTKSFTNLEIGAKSRISELVSGLTVLLIIVLFGRFVSYIPIPTLATIVIVVAFNMIDKEEIIKTFSTTKFDAAIFIATFITTILTPRLDYAIYFGVMVSFILVLKNTSAINYSHISYNNNGNKKFSQEKYKNVKEDDYIVINLSGNLHFNASENLKKKLNRSFRENKIFVIRMRHVESLDLTSIQELEKFINKVQNNGGEVIICGVNEKTRNILKVSGLLDKIKRENCFMVKEDLFSSTKKAIKQAEEKSKE